MTRQQKTPRQRAEEALAIAERAVDRLLAKRNTLLAQSTAVQDELVAATARRDHLKAHPDLQQQPSTTRGDTDR